MNSAATKKPLCAQPYSQWTCPSSWEVVITKASIWYGTRTSLLLLYPCSLADHTCKPFPVISMRLQTDWRCKIKACMWDTRIRHSYKSSTELRLPREVFWIFSCVLLLEASTPWPSHTLSCWAESNVTSIQPFSAEQTVASNIKQKENIAEFIIKHQPALLAVFYQF